MTDNFIEEAALELAEREKWDDSIATSFTKAKYESDIERLLPIIAKHMTSDKAVEAFANDYYQPDSAEDFSIWCRDALTAALKTLEG